MVFPPDMLMSFVLTTVVACHLMLGAETGGEKVAMSNFEQTRNTQLRQNENDSGYFISGSHYVLSIRNDEVKGKHKQTAINHEFKLRKH